MPDATTQHEFSADDNATFDRLVLRMRGVGFWLELYGFLLIGWFVFRVIPRNGVMTIEPFNLVTGLVFLFLGHWTRRGGRAFKTITQTQGNDLTHLMNAIRELSKLYGLIDRLILLGVVLLIVTFALTVMFLLKGGL